MFYRSELARRAEDDETLEVALTFTREPPPDWTGFRRRIDRMMLAESPGLRASDRTSSFRGPTLLVEEVASALVDLDHPASVKTERFGATGGSAYQAPSGARAEDGRQS